MVCSKCGASYEKEQLIKSKYICSECGQYQRIPAYDRIRLIADKGSFSEMFADIKLDTKLIDDEYSEKLLRAKDRQRHLE